MKGNTEVFDHAFLMALRANGNPADPIGPAWLEEMGRDVTALGSYAFLGFVFLSTLGYLFLLRKRSTAVLLTVSVVGGAILSTLFKLGIDRVRPDIPHAARVFTASFPSGHATLSAVTFLTLGAILASAHSEKRFKIYFVALSITLTLFVGLSRLYLGVHYPTDVLSGWCLGAAWAIVCWLTASWHQQRRVIEQPKTQCSARPIKKL
ncbi:phosphatase PAP2 family protein [Pseudomonas sp. 5S4]|uniref:phosphatase PAP2 family protein n=3 Tax=Pseudomonas TaxID=286 RepID=UPI002B23EE17|nr:MULTISPECIES: phosphatase PAP2 family protein [unclassified Pseudomonas]MEB0198218.1 phosphatase PAP2 family protein [Pseudomonas sp. 5S4]MEB0247793.1 phosphatase PAP2 family protein [Pseudomonas sp. 10S5]